MSGIWFFLQVVTGLFLAAVYLPHYDEATASIESINRDGFLSWLVRSVHANGASTIFAALYLHISRSLLISSRGAYAWISGVLLLVLFIVSAFLGYVLVWAQMSYWAATVITSLLTILPCGQHLLEMVWGSICIDQSTLSRFFAWHYIVPLITFALMVVHVMMVHYTGSSGTVCQNSYDKVAFMRYYVAKDGIGLILADLLVMLLLFCFPAAMADAELFTPINTMSTPAHICPEWYLLAYYAMLRCIPSKLYGALLVLVFFILLAHHTTKHWTEIRD